MATKSIKSEYNPLLKAAVLIFTVIFAGLSGAGTLYALRAEVFYPEEYTLTQSVPFAEQLRSDIISIDNMPLDMDYSQNFSYGDYKKNCPAAAEITATFEKDTEYCLKIYDTIVKLKQLRPQQANEDYDFEEYDEEIIEESYEYEEFTAPATTLPYNSDDIFNIEEKYDSYYEWEADYAALRTELFKYVSDATSRETIKADLAVNCENTIRSAYEDAKAVYLNNTVNNHNKNLHFYVSSLDGKFVQTNLPDGTDIERFKKDINENACYSLVFDGKKRLTPEIEVPNPMWFSDFINANSGGIFEINNLTESFENKIVYLKIDAAAEKGDEYANILHEYNTARTAGTSGVGLTAAFALISVALLILLICLCGKQEDGTSRLIWCDKIPFIIKALFDAAVIVLAGAWFVLAVTCDMFPGEFFGSNFIAVITDRVLLMLAAVPVAVISLAICDFAMYVKRNGDCGTFSRRFLLSFIITGIYRSVKSNHNALRERKKMPKSIAIKILIFAVANAILITLMILLADDKLYELFVPCLLIGFIFNFVCLIFAIRFLDGVGKLGDFAAELKNGNYNAVIEREKFVTELRPFAADLDDCRSINENAVNEAIKGERLKTELITNVSHDLKTPLTSIINYVSLLKLDNCTDEDRAKYLDILDEKSTKLKRLIEDLTEASKATSGNIKMNVMPVNLSELALQAVGENSDVLENEGLELVLTQHENDIAVLADSQHTFRIIDNLFSNAKKYSLTGTRVYVDVYKAQGYGCFSIKNVSREKLNISPVELTERFVRGDNSRTTDGSGLGLSIARSFTELQNGIFDISIDGDMFKVTICLPLTSN